MSLFCYGVFIGIYALVKLLFCWEGVCCSRTWSRFFLELPILLMVKYGIAVTDGIKEKMPHFYSLKATKMKTKFFATKTREFTIMRKVEGRAMRIEKQVTATAATVEKNITPNMGENLTTKMEKSITMSNIFSCILNIFLLDLENVQGEYNLSRHVF